jgi:cell division ATPase FtsA
MKMEKRLEKIKNSSNEELLNFILGGGTWRIEAAREALERLEKKEISNEKIYLRAILKIKTIPVDQKEEAEKLKEKAAKRLSKNFLTEDDMLIILDEIESQELRDEITKKFLSENEKVTNSLLAKIIRETIEPKNEAVERILKQEHTKDDLIVILEECEGTIQMTAFEEFKRKGIDKEDAIYVITLCDPKIQEMTWQEVKGKKFSPDDLLEICEVTDSEKVNQEAALKMANLDRLSKEHLFYLIDHPKIDPKTKDKLKKRLLKFDLQLDELVAISEKFPLDIEVKILAKQKAEKEIQAIKKVSELLPYLKKRIEELKALINRLENEIETEFLIAA